jgi:hypothetical protein
MMVAHRKIGVGGQRALGGLLGEVAADLGVPYDHQVRLAALGGIQACPAKHRSYAMALKAVLARFALVDVEQVILDEGQRGSEASGHRTWCSEVGLRAELNEVVGQPRRWCLRGLQFQCEKEQILPSAASAASGS